MMTKQKDEGVSIDGDDIMLMIEGLGIMHCTVLAMMMLVMTMLVTVILITLVIMMMITSMMEGPIWSH